MRPWLAGPIVLAVAGCGVDLPAPAPDGVVPAYGYNGADTIVTITGKHFYPQIEVDATGRNGPDVDDGFRVELVRGDQTEELSGVELVDYRTLEARVPAGLPPGTWDLVVTSPTGPSGMLAGAFEVTDTLADHLRIEPDKGWYEVFDTAWISVQLLDPEQVNVYDPLEVVVQVSKVDEDDGDPQVVFETGSLEEQRAGEDESSIVGRLGNNGRAVIGVTLQAPQFVALTVSPVNERSGIAEGVQLLEWTAGDVSGLEITLREDPLEVTAGEVFSVGLRVVDKNGFTNETPQDVFLTDACGTGWFLGGLRIAGVGVTEASFEKVPSEACPFDRIVNADGFGESTDIKISPAKLDHFAVNIGAGEVVQAGGDLFAEIVPQDGFGNEQAYTGTPLEVTDSAGGIAASTCWPVDKSYFCTVKPVVAGEDITLRVHGQGGITGESTRTYEVVALTPVDVEVEVASDPVTAGTPATVTVTATDVWGNVVDTTGATVKFTDDYGAVSCSPSGTSPSGASEHACLFVVASAGNAVDVALTDWGLTGSSTPFEVVNGALAEVQVTPTTYSVAAGNPVGVTFEGFDAWGNPYVTKSNPTLTIADTSGTFSLKTVNLGGTGEVTDSGSFKLAGATSIVASQGGAELGRSAAVTVVAGSAAELSVCADEPWVWVGDDASVSVVAIDAFGNEADLEGTATVHAVSGEAADATVTLVNGRGTTTLRWTDSVVGDVLQAGNATLSGTSEPFAVVEDCSGAGPSAVLAFAAGSEALACYDAASEKASFAVDMGGSSGAPVDFRVAVDDEDVVASTSSAIVASAGRTGRLDVRGLVIDAAGCGSEAESSAWIGLDDGSAVGPLTLTPAASSIYSGTGSTTVDIEDATTCTGDPAAGATVHVRTDMGAITGASASGTGLAVVLDGTGSGSFTLDAASLTTSGTANVYGGVGDGQAYGETTLEIKGDSRRPDVWEQTPRGQADGAVSDITLTFSEALLPASVAAANFSLIGPDAASIGGVGLSADGKAVTLTLASPVDAGAGTWTVTASHDVRDLAGNRLDTYSGSFGAVPPAADAVERCAASRGRFRPDGDPGVGVETDEIDVSFSSATEPAWWVVSVWSSEGKLVRREFVVPLGASDAWTWDGRDAGERVVNDGTWTIVVDSDDGGGNRGGSCATTVTVENGSGG